jgi:hypothetical protein
MHPEQAEQSGEACWALLCRQYQASARSCWPRAARLLLRPRSPGAMASASASGGSNHAIDRGGHSSNGIERRSTALYGRVLNMTMMGEAHWAGVDWHGSSVAMVEGAISTVQLTQTLEHHTTTRSAKQILAPEWREACGAGPLAASGVACPSPHSISNLFCKLAPRPVRFPSTLPIRQAWKGSARKNGLTCILEGMPDVCFAPDPVIVVLGCSLLLIPKVSPMASFKSLPLSALPFCHLPLRFPVVPRITVQNTGFALSSALQKCLYA